MDYGSIHPAYRFAVETCKECQICLFTKNLPCRLSLLDFVQFINLFYLIQSISLVLDYGSCRMIPGRFKSTNADHRLLVCT